MVVTGRAHCSILLYIYIYIYIYLSDERVSAKLRVTGKSAYESSLIQKIAYMKNIHKNQQKLEIGIIILILESYAIKMLHAGMGHMALPCCQKKSKHSVKSS